jgi:hypothetical protein
MVAWNLSKTIAPSQRGHRVLFSFTAPFSFMDRPFRPPHSSLYDALAPVRFHGEIPAPFPGGGEPFTY